MWGRRGNRPAVSAAKAREARHAGSWYIDDEGALAEELDTWLAATGVAPTPDARAIIAPHAGYSFSGRCAAFAFAQIDPASVKRVFILGPSHHHYTRKCMLTGTSVYKTPVGDLPVDQEVCAALRATGQFDVMPQDVDEAEHSMEMHLPYLARVFRGRSVTLVPILIGALTPEAEAKYGELLASYLGDPANFFSVSSDFCHWGARFHFTYHEAQHGPIHKSIEALDKRGMDLIEAVDPRAFAAYLRESENTICGRHPIAVLLHMLTAHGERLVVEFVRYEQSSRCKSMRDSSVSYASAVVRRGGGGGGGGGAALPLQDSKGP